MNKVIKKAVSVLLIAFMVFGSAPLAGLVGLELPEFNLFSTETKAATYESSCGVNLTWTFDESTGELVISGTGNMADWSDYPDVPWYIYRSSIKSVTITDGVTSIGYYAFFGCTSLTSITIPDSITSIGKYAFYNTAIYSDSTKWQDSVLYIGNYLIDTKNTSISWTYSIKEGTKVIADYAFLACYNLSTITIPDSVANIGNYAFDYCQKLSSVTIGNGVTSIGDYAFYDCTSIKNVYYAGTSEQWKNIAVGLNNNQLTKNLVLYECNSENSYYVGVCGENLTWKLYTAGELIISGTGNMTDMIGYSDVPWYSYRSSIKSVTISEGVTSIGYGAFQICTNLKSVAIPDSVTSIGAHAFGGCKNLTSITIPDGVTSIGYNAFSNCSSLTSITIPISVTSIGNYAFYLTSLEKICYPGTLEQWKNIAVGSDNNPLTQSPILCECNSANSYYAGVCGENLTWKLYSNGELVISGTGDMPNYMIVDSVCTAPWYEIRNRIKTVTIGEGVASIGNCAFYGCSSLINITIADTVTKIGGSAFYNCTNLANITIPDGVTSIGATAFYGCSSLTSITIPDRVTNIGNGAFSKCSKLTSISIPDGVTSIGAHAFEYCSKLQSIVIPDGITSIEDYTFQYCYGLKNVTIPVNVTNIGYWAFAACVGIESANYAGSSEQWKNVTVGSENYELTNELVFECNSERPYYGADDCGENLTWKLYTDGELVISGTGDMTDWIWEEWLSNTNAPWAKKKLKIKTVTIENGVTNIGDYAFSSCNSITQVTIPENIQSINSNAFSDCTNLERIEILGYSVEIADNAFNNSPNVVLYCKSGSTVQSYAELNNIMYVLIDGAAADFAVKNNQLVAYKGNSATPKIPSGVTSIGANAFKDNKTVETLELPESITSIFSGAFSNCSALEEIFIPHTVTTIAADTFNGTNAKIVCYANSTAHQFAVDNNIEFELVKVILNETALVLKVGEYSIITATPEQEYISSAEMSWKSSNASVATVDENGKVTAKNNGVVIISAVAPNGATLATCSVNVIPNEYKVLWVVEGNITNQTYEVGEAIVAPVNPSKSGYKFVGWTPSVPPRMPAYDLMFTAVFEALSPVKADVINPPTQTTISYGDAIILHVDESKVPTGGRIEWTADNGNFSCSANGSECKIKPEKSGSTTITATIYDANGNAVSYGNQKMTAKAGFFDKLVAFFKGLFGLTKTIER